MYNVTVATVDVAVKGKYNVDLPNGDRVELALNKDSEFIVTIDVQLDESDDTRTTLVGIATSGLEVSPTGIATIVGDVKMDIQSVVHHGNQPRIKLSDKSPIDYSIAPTNLSGLMRLIKYIPAHIHNVSLTELLKVDVANGGLGDRLTIYYNQLDTIPVDDVKVTIANLVATKSTGVSDE